MLAGSQYPSQKAQIPTGAYIGDQYVRNRHFYRQDDAAALQQMRERMLAQYGQWFVVRCGKHRMKTFAAILEDSSQHTALVNRCFLDASMYFAD